MEPKAPTSFPSVFNGVGRMMLPRRFAVWFPAKQDYQIYSIHREDWPVIRLHPTKTERPNPYYFASETGDSQSRTFTLYRPRARIHSHIDMAIWHTGGWLCSKQGGSLVPNIPILSVSDPSKLVFHENVGLHSNSDLTEWKDFQTPFFHRPIIHNRIIPVPVKPKVLPTEIPVFVAEALLEKAIHDETTCPISMDTLEKGDSAATSCYHLFRRGILEEWRKTHTDCPVCKQECSITLC